MEGMRKEERECGSKSSPTLSLALALALVLTPAFVLTPALALFPSPSLTFRVLI